MENYPKLAKAITDALHLRMPPVAISFTDSQPAGIPHHTGTSPAGCRFWEEAARKTFVTSVKDHENCAIGMFTHHMPMTSPAQEGNLNDSLKVFADLGYVREEDIHLIPVLKQEARYVVYSPLASAPLPPDVVLLFVRAQEALILSEAAQQVEDGIAPALGRPACAIVPQVMNNGRAALSLGCCGARAYVDLLRDDIAIWALPGKNLADYAERVVALSKANEVLNTFHSQRRKDFSSGLTPTIKESLARFSA